MLFYTVFLLFAVKFNTKIRKRYLYNLVYSIYQGGVEHGTEGYG